MQIVPKIIIATTIISLLFAMTVISFAAEDQSVVGGENRAIPTELTTGIVYSAKGNNTSFTSWPGKRNADWYVIRTVGYDRIIFHFPIITNSNLHWLEVFDEDGNYIESTPEAELNNEFRYGLSIAGNDRIYLQVLFNEWSSDTQARFSICLEDHSDQSNWENNSTHIWKDVRLDKAILQEATCTNAGTKVQKQCMICGSYGYGEMIPQIPHTAGDWITETEPSCEEPGKQVAYCSVCGTVVSERMTSAKGHDFTDWNSLSKATYRIPGLRERYCKVCGKVEKEEYTLAVPDGLLEYGDYELIIQSDGTSKLIGYYGIDQEIDLPELFDGYTLTTIASTAFSRIDNLMKLTIPASVMEIEDGALDSFSSLQLVVTKDSYAMFYAKERNIRYTYPDANDWLNQ